MDFDVALLGCGAYNLPLCAFIKGTMKKPAVYLGGDCQIFFGISGRRWENNEYVNNHKNEYWIYPDASETPASAYDVENGCYWK